MASKHVCLQARKLNSTLHRNTFHSRGQNPCLTYWEIGGNVCPVNIGDVEAAGDIKRGGLTARKEPPLRLGWLDLEDIDIFQ